MEQKSNPMSEGYHQTGESIDLPVKELFDAPFIGTNLSRILSERKLSLTNLYQMSGVSVSYQSRIINEVNRSNNLGFKYLWNMAQALGITVSEFIGEVEMGKYQEKPEHTDSMDDLRRIRNLADQRLEETKNRDWSSPTHAAIEDALAIAEIRSELDFLIRQKQGAVKSETESTDIIN